MADDECMFCKIASGELDADVVRQDERTVAFRDINPQAPTHVLVIPREHIPSVDALDEEHAGLVGELFLAAKEIARQEDVAGAGYRLVMNNGADAGQSVDHIHLHVLGGRRLKWPPG